MPQQAEVKEVLKRIKNPELGTKRKEIEVAIYSERLQQNTSVP